MKCPGAETAMNPLIAELINSVNLSQVMNSNDLKTLKIKETVVNFTKILNKRKVDISMLRSLSFRGIPSDVKALRPLCWKILLGYLPRETSKWEETMKENLSTYEGLQKMLIVIPDMQNEENNNPNFINDHPLSIAKKSLWNQYFFDNVIWQEIEKDIRRTRTDM